MKWFRCFVFTVLLVGSVADINAAEPTVAETFLRQWAAAWKTSNVDRMMQFYDDGPETLAIESLGHVRQGPEQIRKMFEGAFEELVFDRVSVTILTQKRQDSVAWATFRYRANVRLKETQMKFVLQSRGTFILRNDGKTWKIATEHFSTIPDVPRVQPDR
ncbi:YybH family protein [Thalassoroseus pseudoceratinae]|uniref:YybH family protein n=1 Tax=Thalassoroseus pseudoceratinae TaxID=2713176 RepID=UPI00141EF8E8|nr:nuclear transport factor 2 family protein [Thalassoroseus pseudoceratinae]